MAKEQFSRSKPHVNISIAAMNLERAGVSPIGAHLIANGQIPVDSADQARMVSLVQGVAQLGRPAPSGDGTSQHFFTVNPPGE